MDIWQFIANESSAKRTKSVVAKRCFSSPNEMCRRPSHRPGPHWKAFSVSPDPLAELREMGMCGVRGMEKEMREQWERDIEGRGEVGKGIGRCIKEREGLGRQASVASCFGC